ncbi:MAG TPA: putative metallopeptidase [Methanosarcinales archaeon]|nr:putative metallopeptidase [Methanosarcinales archaeon]
MRILALLLLIGCGTPIEDLNPTKKDKKYEVADKELESYINLFEEESKSRKAVSIDNLIVEYGNTADVGQGLLNLLDVTIGVCYSGSDTPRIVIDKSYWADATDTQKEVLMFHELGHCILGRGHDTRLDNGKVPVSVMYPTIFTFWYTKKRKYYLDELFLGGY